MTSKPVPRHRIRILREQAVIEICAVDRIRKLFAGRYGVQEIGFNRHRRDGYRLWVQIGIRVLTYLGGTCLGDQLSSARSTATSGAIRSLRRMLRMRTRSCFRLNRCRSSFRPVADSYAQDALFLQETNHLTLSSRAKVHWAAHRLSASLLG